MDRSIDKIIARVGKLPPMPHVAAKILELVNKPETSTQDLKKVIDSDQVLAMRLLKVVNSALYALPQKVTSLSQAIVMLGFNHIRSLVLAEAVQNLFKSRKDGRADLLETLLWEHSVGAALGARTVAQFRFPGLVEEAFVAALIHDVGKLILLQGEKERYQQIVQTVYRDNLPFGPMEREVFGADHAEVGASLAQRWNLEPSLVEAIHLHHEEEGGSELADLVRMGNAMAWKAQWGFRRDPDLDLASLSAAQRLEIPADAMGTLMEAVLELMESERQTFDVGSPQRSPSGSALAG